MKNLERSTVLSLHNTHHVPLSLPPSLSRSLSSPSPSPLLPLHKKTCPCVSHIIFLVVHRNTEVLGLSGLQSPTWKCKSLTKKKLLLCDRRKCYVSKRLRHGCLASQVLICGLLPNYPTELVSEPPSSPPATGRALGYDVASRQPTLDLPYAL